MSAIVHAPAGAGPRLPLGPLESTLAAYVGMVEACGRFGPNVTRLALALGVNVRQLYRWRRSGVTWQQADELAHRAGYHPCEIWGADWWSIDDGGS